MSAIDETTTAATTTIPADDAQNGAIKQPGAASLAAIYAIPDAAAELLGAGQAHAEQLAKLLAGAERVFLVGTGTSFHSATFGEHLLRAVGVDAWAVPAFEFALYPRPLRLTDAVVAISHRGNKRYTVAALDAARDAGVPAALVTGRDTKYAGAGDGTSGVLVVPTVAQEASSMHTISLTGSFVALAMTAIALGRRASGSAATSLADGLARLPDALRAALTADAQVADIARATVARGGRLYYAGGGPNTMTAPEGALKVKESAYLTAEGISIEGFIHGPWADVEPEDLVTVIAPAGPSRARALDLIRALEPIGTPTWLIGQAGDSGATYETGLPDVPEVLSPVVAAVPLNLFAYHLARERGTDADAFRLDDERFKRGFATITL